MLARIASCALAALALVGAPHASSGWTNTFPPGNGLNGTVRALLAFDDGSGPALFVGGDFTTAGGIPANHIARLDGDHWSPLGLGVDGPVHALVVFDDGTGPALHVGGDFVHAGSGAANRIAKWDGSQWFHLGSWTDELVRTLAVNQGVLYAGGQPGIARWTGTSWVTLGGLSTTFDGIRCLASFDSGGGNRLHALGDIAGSSVVRWNGGTSWTNLGAIFASGQPGCLLAADVGQGLSLYVAGQLDDELGNSFGIGRWTGSGWTVLPGLFRASCLAAHDDGGGPDLYAGGQDNLVAKFEDGVWHQLGTGVNGTVHTMASFDDGTGAALFVAGSISAASGSPAERIARWCCAPPASVPFCLGTESVCPCDGGAPGAGCQTASGSGGVTLSVLSQSTQPNGAILVGQGYPSMGAPTAVVIRSPMLDPASPVIFGDGVRCISPTGLVRLAASVAVGGVSTHVIGHNSAVGPGTFYYQLWFRDTPSTYCDPSTAFNLSSGRTLTW